MPRPPESIPIRNVPGVGEAMEAALGRLDIRTAEDLLRWYPRIYIDASNPLPIAELEAGRMCAIKVEIDEIHQRRSAGRGVRMIEAAASDLSGKITLRWFNQPYLERRLVAGSEWVFIGTPERFGKGWTMLSPLIETEPRILSVYAQTKGVTSKMLRGYVDWALRGAAMADDAIPAEIRAAEGLPTHVETLRAIHQPATMEEVGIAQRQIGFEEVFWFFVSMLAGKRQQTSEKGIPILPDVPFLQALVAGLPFELTAGQKRAVWDILQEMESGQPMTRLLNGDVGSGKTVVAGLVGAVVAKNGLQSILLVPTEILAKQHAASLAALFGGALNVRLWTAAQKESLDEADLIVGTHAVLQQSFSLPRLAFVVIDEQHRFGVRQRQFLREGVERPPHVLSMTATPIPRTLALTLYGNLSVSVLKEKPKDRLPVTTAIITPARRQLLHERILAEIAQGNQVFVVCPLIQEKLKEEDGEPVMQLFDTAELETKEKKTVLAEAERLRAEHPEYGVIEAIHGKLKSEQKREIMEKMGRGEINVLVATSVIEVGVDVPRATVIIIEGAEHFGLAQLHQFRGRVGRSDRQSYCFLCPALVARPIMERLEVLVHTQSGFEVAEADLELRGPGELVGRAQSGLPDFRMASLTDMEFLQHVRGVATDYIEKHPEFIDSYLESPYSGVGMMAE